jgi:hypothetical protein
MDKNLFWWKLGIILIIIIIAAIGYLLTGH